ncbi:Glycine--tRNA ligase [Tritrichomonas foetus]|uniref:glycine--tRNA ligase n=1 Tax=Tritrichomonas foetus TaxID=1144522 RepID=A0A1J4JU09_9EUKA|nr:Glycine--tRNA ligase [Tritrichomonas foetus]|eukprot:OHT02617.1 Glycine--tRNA ligase [Tritrichomonas foetus]
MAKDTRATLENLELQRFFFCPSFEIYGGTAGLYDLGPSGAAIERNLLNKWRDHFVIEEDMVEVRCSMLTPYKVLESSGHTAKFSDFMVSDTVDKMLYRADQLLELVLQKRIDESKSEEEKEKLHHDLKLVSDMNGEQLDACIEKWGIKSPNGNPLSKAVPFNLMFNTMIGPGERAIPGFLRPETAQGIFVNFPRLLDFNRGKLPFAAAQQGVAYRNEIAPRNQLVRCREFMMAEIEHFCDPLELDNVPKFETVKDLKISLFSSAQQAIDGAEAVEMTLEEAVNNKVICHKTLAYFVGRTYLFMVHIGIDPKRLRFRQHRDNEKAHYARDCWDAEIYLESMRSWLECTGIADRQAFDLTRHGQVTAKKGEQYNTQFVVNVTLPEPIVTVKVQIQPIKSVVGRLFKADAKAINTALEEYPEAEAEEVLKRFTEAEALLGGKPAKGKEKAAIDALSEADRAKFNELTTIEVAGKKLDYTMVTVAKTETKTNTRSFIPTVIEPSFGVGRIITALLEHSFYLRPDGQRRVLRLKPFIAPYSVVLLRISAKLVPENVHNDVRKELRRHRIVHICDDSSITIGRKYARTDEIGIPFAITLDGDTVTDGTVTLRERDTTNQIRLPIKDAIREVKHMINEEETWESVSARYPSVQPPADAE